MVLSTGVFLKSPYGLEVQMSRPSFNLYFPQYSMLRTISILCIRTFNIKKKRKRKRKQLFFVFLLFVCLCFFCVCVYVLLKLLFSHFLPVFLSFVNGFLFSSYSSTFPSGQFEENYTNKTFQ